MSQGVKDDDLKLLSTPFLTEPSNESSGPRDRYTHAEDLSPAMDTDGIDKFTPYAKNGRVPGDYSGSIGFLRDVWRNNFVSRLSRVVGIRFVIITLILYGLDEGGIEALNELGRVYFFKERGFEPSQTQRAIAWSSMSWNVKPIFALAMDTMPIFGYHLRPYIVLMGILGTTAYAIIAWGPTGLSNGVFILMMFLGSFVKDTCD